MPRELVDIWQDEYEKSIDSFWDLRLKYGDAWADEISAEYSGSRHDYESDRDADIADQEMLKWKDSQ
mgnify:FL=1|tara:strand:- start:24194 stop:24394 length:201 start_codon:yes stop_codon:yes gene_type:complete